MEASRGIDGGYQLAPGSSLPPLVLDDDEAVALAVGLRSTANTAVAGVAEASIRALAKVTQTMPHRLRRQVDALGQVTVPVVWHRDDETISAADLTAVAQACRDEARLRFGYVSREGAASERYVEPYRLVTLGRRWYLLAFDLDRDDWRTFRVDRLTAPEPARNRFDPRPLPAADVAAYVREQIALPVTASHEVEVMVELAADRVRQHVGRWGTVDEVDEERCRLRMTVDSLDWPAMVLGGPGADFTVITPDDLAAHLARIAEVFARNVTPATAT